jgi:hypothetical protein
LETERYHDRALAMLDSMFAECQQNLIRRKYNVDNAAVFRQHWREAMQSKFSLGYGYAGEQKAKLIEENLRGLGKIEINSSFVKPVIAEPEPVQSHELTVTDKFFCMSCKKFKGIPHNHRRYYVGDQVNFTQKGVRGVANNAVASIQTINGRLLEIATATRYIKLHADSVTPIWAPSPLMYSTMGQCWCDIDPAYSPGGAQC